MLISPELEYFAYNNKSFMARLNAFAKVFLLFAYLLLNLKLSGIAYLNFIVFVSVIFFISRIPLRILKRPLFFATFTGIFLFLAKLHFYKKGAPVIFFLDFYPASFTYALLSAMRVVVGVVLMLIFISTTPIKDILNVLYKIKVPVVIIETILIIYKYIFILNEECYKMQNAQAVRLGYNNFRKSLESFGTLLGLIVMRGYNRGNKIADAMMVRGFNGNLFYPSPIRHPDLSEYFLMLILGFLPLVFVFVG